MIDLETQRALQDLFDRLPSKLAVRAAMHALTRAVRTGDLAFLRRLTAPPEYDRRPVSMKQFIEDSDYFGGIEALWPDLKDDLIRLFDEGHYVEVIVSGGIGTGKTTFTSFAYARMLYELSCLTDPAAYLGLIQGATVFLVNQSVSLKQAKNVLFGEIQQRVHQSPYFKTFFSPDPNFTTELRFPKNIVVLPLASGDKAALGLNIFGGTLDEVAFYAVVEQSKMTRSVNEIYDYAEKMYSAVSRRLRSRFMQAGGYIPGKLFLVSSANYAGDFMERKKKAARNDPMVFIRDKALWETKVIKLREGENPEQYDERGYSKEMFQVELGAVRPRVLQRGELPSPNTEVIAIPMNFLEDFERNTSDAVRDIAGRATSTIDPFLTDVTPLEACIDEDRVHPFTELQTNLQDGVRMLVDEIAEQDDETKRWRPKFFPGEPRFAHIDYALTNDECGVAVGCPAGMVEVERRDMATLEMRKFKAPIIHVDVMLKIVAPPGGEIDLEEVRSMVIFALIERGFWIRRVTFDQYASQEAMQQLRRRGIESEHLSVDEKMEPYLTWKEAVQEHRCRTYRYAPYQDEAGILEIDRIRGKVDHPPGKDKGVTDAVASVCEQVTIAASIGVLGVLEYNKQRVEAMAEEQRKRLQKPIVNEKTEACPKCGSTAVVRIGHRQRCNQCGEMWGEAPKSGHFDRKELFK